MTGMDPTPRVPTRVSPHAKACLEAVAAAGLGEMLSVGGAFGLAYPTRPDAATAGVSSPHRFSCIFILTISGEQPTPNR